MMDRRRQNRILLALVLLAAAPMVFIQHLPLQDLPGWTVQSEILSNLDDARFAPYYSLLTAPVPNSLATVLISALGTFVGSTAAARLVALLTLFVFTFGFVSLRRMDGRLTPHIEILGALFCANHFFMMGYLNFVLGAGIAFFAVGYHRRRAAFFPLESSVVLAGLLTLTYFAHFFAFFSAVLAVGLVSFSIHKLNWKKLIPPAIAIVPGLVFLLWYAVARSGSFALGYELTPLKFVWYKLAPFAVLTNFEPLTPPLIAWVAVLINASVIFLLALLLAWLVKEKSVDLRSPLTIAALVLALLGLLAPTRLFELVRPGQRMLFIAFFFFLADVEPPRLLRKEVRSIIVTAIAVLVLLNSANTIAAGRAIDGYVEKMESALPAEARLLLVDGSYFDFQSHLSTGLKVLDPFSYPTAVHPLKAVGYYPLLDHGGLIGYLFPSGLIRVTPDRPPAVNRWEQLIDPERTASYTHIIVTGNTDEVAALVEAAAHSFRTATYDLYFAILEKKPPEPAPDDSFSPGLFWLY
jgi:hypothetical protein